MSQWNIFRYAPSAVVVQHDDRSIADVDFVSFSGEDVVWPISDEPDANVRETLESNGYEVKGPLNAAPKLTIPTDDRGAPSCNECGKPMLERKTDRTAGGTPTSPSVGVLFECPVCGHGLRTTRKRQ